jgi:hypothetical protein
MSSTSLLKGKEGRMEGRKEGRKEGKKEGREALSEIKRRKR